MSGPNPPGPESEELEPGVEPSEGDSEFEEGGSEFGAEPADADSQTDVYSRAYSAPESEHVSSGPYVPVDLDLYDYDSFDEVADDDRITNALPTVGARITLHHAPLPYSARMSSRW